MSGSDGRGKRTSTRRRLSSVRDMVELTGDTPAGAVVGSPSETFEEYYRRCFKVVLRAGYLLSGSVDEAEELTQEAFARTWAAWASIRSGQQPLYFTLAVMRNLYTSLVRRTVRWRRSAPMLWDRPGSESPTELADSRTIIRKCVKQLPLKQRWAVVLADLLDLPSDEVARVMGVAPSTARVHLMRGREALRRHLAIEQLSQDVSPRQRKEAGSDGPQGQSAEARPEDGR